MSFYSIIILNHFLENVTVKNVTTRLRVTASFFSIRMNVANAVNVRVARGTPIGGLALGNSVAMGLF